MGNLDKRRAEKREAVRRAAARLSLAEQLKAELDNPDMGEVAHLHKMEILRLKERRKSLQMERHEVPSDTIRHHLFTGVLVAIEEEINAPFSVFLSTWKQKMKDKIAKLQP
jgi:hypothetical protein